MDMRLTRTSAIAIVLLMWIGRPFASGPLGIYGIVEKVVFEPDEKSPERVQVWGAFAYADGFRGSGVVSAAVRGYLYFGLPKTGLDVVRTEWADLKSVAGTGQAVGFGKWGYIGSFGSLQPDKWPSSPSLIYYDVPQGGEWNDLRVRPASEKPSGPGVYQTDAGIVRLPEASHATVIRQLREAQGR
jgi:hypothetical protein